MWNEILVVVVGCLIGIYLLAMGLAYLVQDRLIFPAPSGAPVPPAGFDSATFSFQYEGVTFYGWLVSAPQPRHHGLLFYCGGNAEEVSWNLERFATLGVGHVALVNYRGFAGTAGSPSERALVEDAAALLDHLEQRTGTPPERTVVMGRSLGTGVAVQLAARRKLAGLILVTPLASVTRLARRAFPLLPVGLLLRHRFDSLAVAAEVTIPAEMIIATCDQVIPAAEGRLLAKRWAAPVHVVEFDHCAHDDIHQHPGYGDALATAVSRLLPPEAG